MGRLVRGGGSAFKSRVAVGKKLCECLVFRVFSDRNLLPEGSGAKRPWPGCAGSAIIFLALPRALLLNRAPRGGKGHPITLSAERITRCSLALSLAAAAGNQVMMAEVTMDSMMTRSNVSEVILKFSEMFCAVLVLIDSSC